jgi:Leucine-rich repeat (LRR) protein
LKLNCKLIFPFLGHQKEMMTKLFRSVRGDGRDFRSEVEKDPNALATLYAEAAQNPPTLSNLLKRVQETKSKSNSAPPPSPPQLLMRSASAIDVDGVGRGLGPDSIDVAAITSSPSLVKALGDVTALRLGNGGARTDGSDLFDEERIAREIAAQLRGDEPRPFVFNVLGWGGATRLVAALEACERLRVLDLEGNRIGGEGGTALAVGLRQLDSLTELDLSFNTLGDLR